VTGTLTIKADGTFVDNTTTPGEEHLTLPASCLVVSAAPTTCDGIAGPLSGVGYASINCASAAGGGCTCTGTVQQTGGIGLLTASPTTEGNYATSGNQLTLTVATDTKYSYCVSDRQLTITPQSTDPSTSGTIVLQNGGAAGSPEGGAGGARGTGGGGGAGGATGSGGTNASGGAGGTRDASATGSGGAVGTDASTGTAQGPCDIYAAGNTPCAAAYSMVRRLSSRYGGPLYQVRKGGGAMNTGTGGTTQDIGTVAGGFGDAAAQDAFCGTDTCTVSKLYDQSGNANDLIVAPAGCYVGPDPNNPDTASMPDFESNAKGRSLMVGGHRVYALFTAAREGYRNNGRNGMPPPGMPTAAAAQGIYQLADARHAGTACCWDFGNAGTDNCNGTRMKAVFFGTGFWGRGAGTAPWFMADFEGGVWSGGATPTSGPSATNNTTSTNPSMTGVDYAFGILKTSTANNTPQYAIKAANVQSGALITAYDGPAPFSANAWNSGGGIVLGIGGDNSNHSFGTFFEGAITNGRPSDQTDALILQNVQAQGYGR